MLGSFGRSRARRYQPSGDRVTFADVAGIEEAKAELTEVVDFLRHPEKYRKLGGRIPHGVLLSGATGTGKTLLARAVAGEAEAPFFSIAASEFVEAIVGVGASRVRDLFKQAMESAPAIVFIDELDAIGRSRTSGVAGFSGGNDEREQTLNQILTEMDGFDSSTSVIVIGATNRPDVLDQALLRPGRFDRRVAVQPPDRAGREAILKVHTRGVPLAPDVELGRIAATTPGMVGADLANLVNEAALLAARRSHDQVEESDFTDALERIVLGAERQVMLSAEDKRRTAYHEGGHAIVGMLTEGADPVRKVSIIPRGLALGVTFAAPETDRFNYREPEVRAKIKVALGGRAAEEVVYGETSTGAESDIQQLTGIARQMVGRWGMSPAIGPIAVLPRDGSGPFLPGAAETSPHTQELRRRGGPPDRRRRVPGGRRAPHAEPRQARRARERPARARDARRGGRVRGRRCRSRRGGEHGRVLAGGPLAHRCLTSRSSGSAARSRGSPAAARRCIRALEGAEAAGAETRMLDLRELDLPMYNPDEAEPTESAATLIEACYTADGLIWSSPMYQGTISGAFKNALDWLHVLGQRDPPYLHDKVIGLVSAAGGTHGLQAINTMEFAVRALRGWAVPYVVPVATAARVFDAEGRIHDEGVEHQLDMLGTRGRPRGDEVRRRRGAPPPGRVRRGGRAGCSRRVTRAPFRNAFVTTRSPTGRGAVGTLGEKCANALAPCSASFTPTPRGATASSRCVSSSTSTGPRASTSSA